MQLTVHIHPTTYEATVTVTLPADELDNVAAAATAVYPETDAPEHAEHPRQTTKGLLSQM